MALSRPLNTSLPVASNSELEAAYCRFCGTKSVSRALVNLQSKDEYYKSVLAKLKYMNITPAAKIHMNVCQPCYHSFNKAYGFCHKFNRTQILLADICTGARRAAKAAAKVPSLALDIKIEQPSDDDLDVDADDVLPPYNKKKKQFVDLGKSWSSYSWTCCHCDANFKELDMLRSHSKTKHGICYAFECPDCDLQLAEYEHFISHVRNHRDNLRFFCDVCNKPLPFNGRHKHAPEHLTCRWCGEIFPDNESILKHHKNYEKISVMDTESPELYKITVPDIQVDPIETALPDCDLFQSWKDYIWACSGCDVRYHSAAAIRTHGVEVHNNCLTMKCVDCDATFDVFHKFILHIMRHRPSLRHFCPFCDRIAHTDKGFRDHVKIHFTNSSYCPECGQIYAQRFSTLDEPSMTSVLWFLEPPGTNVELEERSPPQARPAQPNQARTNRQSNTQNGNIVLANERPNGNESDGESSSSSSSSSENSNEGDTDSDDSDEENMADLQGIDGAENLRRLVSLIRDSDPLGVEYALPEPTPCEFCKVVFSDKRLYREHTQTRYCLICDKAYYCAKKDEKHLFSQHMVDKPYECYKCGKCYRLRANAFTCMEKHLADKTIMCKICNSTVLKSFLAEHIEAHRNEPRKNMACGLNFCQQSFESWENLVNHRYSKHLTVTFRKVRVNSRYLAQRNMGILSEESFEIN